MSHMRRIDTVLLQREFHFSGIGQRERGFSRHKKGGKEDFSQDTTKCTNYA